LTVNLLDVLARSGVDDFLKSLIHTSDSTHARPLLEDKLADAGSTSASGTLDELLDLQILQRVGPRFGISQYGHRIALLLEAMRGGDIEQIYRRLRQLEGFDERYELVRQGMTTRFLGTLAERPYFGRLYFCSPWINLNEKEAALVRHGLIKSQGTGSGKNPEILVITRPLDEHPDGIRTSGLGIQPLVDMGAKVYFLKKVHTKLYIREPDENGGYSTALVGSENLTQSNYLELGIQIHGDNQLIAQLIAHFIELTSYSFERT
jgi:hypothetical protein